MNQSVEIPRELHTRFLHPFTFDAVAVSLGTLETALGKLKLTRRKRDVLIWEATDLPSNDNGDKPTSTVRSLYLDEGSENAVDFLFLPPNGERSIGGRYLRMPDASRSQLFPHGLCAIRQEDGFSSQQPRFKAALEILNVELFLSSLGTGVLSITLVCQSLTDANSVKAFNYWLSQRRRYRRPHLYLPHPTDDAERYRNLLPEVQKNIPEPPDPHSPLESRLARQGGRYDLEELKDYLLTPIGAMREVQMQFGVYSVVRFGSTVRFLDKICRAELGPLLSSLAQIEEAHHPGSATAEHLGVESALLNVQHWAAVGSIGMAHLVADDHNPPQDFDHQRMAHVRDKYFISFLLAFLQSLFLGRLEREAATIARTLGRGNGTELCAAQFPVLRHELLLFDLLAYPKRSSQRAAHIRAYRLAQVGLDVPRAFADVSRAVSEMEAACRFENQRLLLSSQEENLGKIAAIQHKVENVEVFLVAVYSIYLIHYTGEAFFDHGYVGWATIFGSMLATLLAYVHLLEPWKSHGPHQPPAWTKVLRWIGMLRPIYAVLLLLALYLGFGFKYFPLEHHPVTEAVGSDKTAAGK